MILMKKNKIIIAMVILVWIIFLFPIPMHLKDGGTIEYKAIAYKISKVHRLNMNAETGYDNGIIVEILGFKVYDNVNRTSNIENDDMKSVIKAVVVKVNEKHILAMETEDKNGLYMVGLNSAKNIEFKKGQEILIYFDGNIMETYPAQLGNIGKIEVIKEKSDIQIPDNIIRFCYNSKDKVNVAISEFTNSGITLNITDTNELPYNYAHSYIINKKVRNEDYTGKGEKIGKDTKNSIAGFTRNRIRIFVERSRQNF